MITYDATNADCFVFTEKEGLLSKMAHDLRIRVTSFQLELGEGGLTARFDAASLRVVCALRDGHDDASALSAKDRAEIEGNIRKDVLASSRYPEIVFQARDTAALAALRQPDEGPRTLSGALTLHGITRPLDVRVDGRGDRITGEARIHQPDFGIKPYSALLGTLKVKPHLKVELSVPRT